MGGGGHQAEALAGLEQQGGCCWLCNKRACARCRAPRAEDGVALEGPVFRNMKEEELLPLLPKLQVGAGGLGWECTYLRA